MLEQLNQYVRFPWALIGDLNQVLYQEDKKGGRRVMGYPVERMRRVMDSYGFVDLNFYGPRFTWTNKHHGCQNIQQRLDQCWGNSRWHESFPEAPLHHLLSTHSDHNPLLLDLVTKKDTLVVPVSIRFQANLMEHKDFGEFVKMAWPPSSTNLCEAITLFWEKLKVWNHDIYGNLFHTKK